MQRILKSLIVVVNLSLFLVLEAFCASKIIWHYDWSAFEENSLILFACATIGFDILMLFVGRFSKDISFAFSCFVIKLEVCIAVLCSCILLVALLNGTLTLKRSAVIFIIQGSLALIKSVGILAHRKL